MTGQDLVNLETVAIAIVLLSIWVCWRYLKNDAVKYPPGPSPLPIIGNLHLMVGKDRRDVFDSLRAKYGDIFTLYFGPHPFIVVCGFNRIKEVFQINGDKFMGRPEVLLGRKTSKGIVRSVGKTWTEQRRFTLSTLKDLGLGRNLLATRIMAEMDFLQTELDKYANSGEPMDPNELMDRAISNAINFMLFGRRFEYDDKNLIRALDIRGQVLKLAATVGLVDLFPLLKYFPGDIFKVKRIKTLLADFRQIMTQFISNVVTDNAESTQDSLVAAYKRQIRKVKDDPETTFDESQLIQVGSDIFTAASDTTHTVVMWIFLYLLHYPEVQQRMWEEIRDNIGVDRKPAMSDRQNVPFVEAVLLEALRHSDMGPITAPRCALENTWVGKYFFPVGSRVLGYMHSISMDKQQWGDPENFRPSRFLDENGHFHKPEHAAFFFVGRRNCPGEPFARMNLFLTMASLVQRYEFLPPDDSPIPPLVGVFAVTNQAPPYRMKLKLRNTV